MAGRSVRVKGSEIRQLRESGSYERSELARVVGIDPHSLYRIEAGIMNTSRPTLRRIALALGVPPDQLREIEPQDATISASS